MVARRQPTGRLGEGRGAAAGQASSPRLRPALERARVATAPDEDVEGAPDAGAAEDEVAAAERDHVEAVAQAGEREADGGEWRVGAGVGEHDGATAGALTCVVEALAGGRVD